MKVIRNHVVSLLLTTAYNNGGWKLDKDGKIEMKDGNPIWVDANGGESVMDGGTITRLNGEAKKLRERAEAAETASKVFEGLDPVKAKEAMEMFGKIDQKKLIDAGEVDKVRNEISQQYTTQLTEKDNALKALQSQYDNAQISNVFSQSDFIRNRVALPADMFEAYFRNNVKINNGQLEFTDKSGNRLMSEKRIGEYADTSEAFELLVNKHPQKDIILRADDASGSGSGGGAGGRGGGRTVKRAEFEKLPPAQQAEVAAKARSNELQIID